jgi:hypothetical protein
MPFMRTLAASTVVVLCRLGTIALLFAPVVGWVAFNMAQPFFNQMNRMTEIQQEAAGASAGGRKKRGLAGAVGLGAALSMAAAQQADAATELSQLAASDNRCAQQLGALLRTSECAGALHAFLRCVLGIYQASCIVLGPCMVLHFVLGPFRVPALCSGAIQGSRAVSQGMCVTPEQPQEYSSRVNATM